MLLLSKKETKTGLSPLFFDGACSAVANRLSKVPMPLIR